MAIDFDTLTGSKDTTGSIKNRANHADLPVEDILTEAQAWIYERVRVREMRTTARIALAEDDDSIDISAYRFLGPVLMRLDGYDNEIDYVHENLLRRLRDSDGDLYPGRPTEYTVNGELVEFNVKADAAYEGDFTFYQRPEALATGANNTNWLTTRFPTLLVSACMAFAWRHRNRADMFAAAMQGPFGVEALIYEANVASDLARMGQRMRASR
jgi:hypothetical protein